MVNATVYLCITLDLTLSQNGIARMPPMVPVSYPNSTPVFPISEVRQARPTYLTSKGDEKTDQYGWSGGALGLRLVNAKRHCCC